MIIINKLPTALPTEIAIGYEEELERADFEMREDIGLNADANGRKPLAPAERLKHRKYKGQKALASPPKWNGREFKFAKFGEQGCAYDLPESVAYFLARSYNRYARYVCEKKGDEILHILKDGEALPKDVTPLRPHVDDPLRFSAESISSRGRVVSAGYAKPPEPLPLSAISIPVGVDGAPAEFSPGQRK